MNAMKSRRPGRQRGVVLVAVLWIAAALVLIVAGIGASAKGDVRAAGVPVADILTQLVRKANPVTTVKEPSEIDQKLVWLVAPDPDDPASKIVLVTTRAAATEKKLALPAIFQPKP